MEDKKEQLLKNMFKLMSNLNINETANMFRNVIAIVSLTVALIAMVVKRVEMAGSIGDSPNKVVLNAMFLIAMIVDVAFLCQQIIQLVLGVIISKMNYGFISQKEYIELIVIEKKLRRISLWCDLVKELGKSSIAIALGLLFVVAGIQLGTNGQNGNSLENLMYIVLFPLMGISAMFIFCEPVILIIKDLFQTDDTDWETYYEQLESSEKKKRFHIADIKVVLVGSLFFLIGFFACWSSIYREAGQAFAGFVVGLIFMAIGGSVAYFWGIKGGSDGM